MSADLVQEVAEALYDLEPLVTGYGDRERKLTWTEAQYEGYSGKYLRRAEAAIPIILDAAEAVINEVVDERGFTESTDYDHFAAIDVIGVMDAIDKLRTKP